jgi:2-dehydro-3-deoxyphosphogluconate aldolase/(4S)-4-hydroxy-2-oxoglutarate aldolase
VKLYPSAPVGPGYVSLLRGPLPQIRIICTGGLEPETAVDFIRAGAVAVGIGGRLCPQRMDEVEESARLAAETLRVVDAERGR